MIRKIVKIDEDKCNGCGDCVTACHEGAIELVDNKAKLVSDIYCDGLGDCLPGCPTGAISIIERESLPYDDDAVQERMKEMKNNNIEAKENLQGCPGTVNRIIERPENKLAKMQLKVKEKSEDNLSQLQQWPVQLKLVNSSAPYLKNANLLVAADCTAFAYGSFHNDFIKGRIVVIGCPKLDDVNFYKEKIQEIIQNNDLKSITVVRMEVPCCGGIVAATKKALLDAKTIIQYNEVIIGVNGEIQE
ncbi:MAG: ATP-binding protein [Clostridiaceae bacterium]